MSRRISLPGADELFRSTGSHGESDDHGNAAPSAPSAPSAPAATAEPAAPADRASERRPVAEAGTSLRVAADPDGSAATEAPDGDLRSLPVRHSGVRRRPRATGERRPTGRERHEEKITVYVSAEELLDLEHARLGLRGEHGLAVDRGRIVREALAVVLADFDAKGESSILVRRLLGR